MSATDPTAQPAASAVACRFRPAETADAAFCDRALPADRDRGVSFVGVRPGETTPVAAFAVAPPIERYQPPGLGLAMYLDASVESSTAGQQIVTLAKRMAASASLGPLHAWPFPNEGSIEAARFARLGFQVHDRIRRWRIKPIEARTVLANVITRLRTRRPHDPAWQAQDVPLEAIDDLDPVVRLYERTLADLGPLRSRLIDRLQGRGAHPFHGRYSHVLMREGTPIAAILISLVDRHATVEARLVADGYRDGAANVRLMDGSFNADVTGTDQLTIDFESHDAHRGTVGLAARLGGVPVGVRLKLRLDP